MTLDDLRKWLSEVHWDKCDGALLDEKQANLILQGFTDLEAERREMRREINRMLGEMIDEPHIDEKLYITTYAERETWREDVLLRLVAGHTVMLVSTEVFHRLIMESEMLITAQARLKKLRKEQAT